MPVWLRITLSVLCAVGLLGWVASATVPPLQRRSDIVHFFLRCIFTAAVLLFLGWSFRKYGPIDTFTFLVHSIFSVAVLVVLWARQIGGIIARPFTGIFDGGGERVKPEPLYSIAEARRKQGKIREAMYEIHSQLEKFPNDFRGQMLLAEIQAENANDVPGADATIRRICSQRHHSPNQVSAALAALADWHLQFEQDIDAARECFQEIIQRYPNTDFAASAEQRIAHLAERAAVIESRAPRTLFLPSSDGMKLTAPNTAEVTAASEEEIARVVAHLTQFPNDIEAREDLARRYAEDLGRVDLASEQLELLIALEGQSAKQTAHWLNRLADFQSRLSNNSALAAATLQRIIDRFPSHPAAAEARERIAQLTTEARRANTPQVRMLNRERK